MAQSTIHVHCYRYGSIVLFIRIVGCWYREVDTMGRVVLQNSRDSLLNLAGAIQSECYVTALSASIIYLSAQRSLEQTKHNDQPRELSCWLCSSGRR